MMSDSLHQSFLVGPVAIRLWLCSSVLLCDWFASPVLLVLSPAVMASGSHPASPGPQGSSTSWAPKSSKKYCGPVMAASPSVGHTWPIGSKTAPSVGGFLWCPQTHAGTLQHIPNGFCLRRYAAAACRAKIGDCTMGCTQVTMCFSATHRAFRHSALVGTSSPSSVAVAHRSHFRSPVARWFGAASVWPKGPTQRVCSGRLAPDKMVPAGLARSMDCEDLGGGPSARPAPTLHSLLFRLLMLRL